MVGFIFCLSICTKSSTLNTHLFCNIKTLRINFESRHRDTDVENGHMDTGGMGGVG